MMEFLTCVSSALVAVTQTITLFLLFWRHRVILSKTFQLQTSFCAAKFYCSLTSAVSFLHTQPNAPSRSNVSGMVAIAAIYHIAELFVNPSVLFV